MTFLAAAIKAACALALCVAMTFPVAAAAFKGKRGINLDIWTTWPDESRWSDPAVLLPFPEWRRTVGPTELAALGGAGFDFVRIPVDPSPFLSPESASLRDKLIASVVESARLVNQAGLKAIVDLHLFPAGGNRAIGMAEVLDDPATFERYLDLVRRMGLALSREDVELVAFELMNEPVTDCAEAEDAWSEHLKRLFAAARASAPRLTLVLSGACWSSADGLARLDPGMIPDDNVIWTFHSYDPFLLTHQGATWAGDFIRYVTGIPYPPDARQAETEAALTAVRSRIED
ncbi:MAG: cellulase family glycosylhydrolase, partial [Rhizobiaceae bacterium]|nr:cellulase family glycosylhydrolase [Rhizobiaceae bacterium]